MEGSAPSGRRLAARRQSRVLARRDPKTVAGMQFMPDFMAAVRVGVVVFVGRVRERVVWRRKRTARRLV